jgi:ABC-2 type transport system permease protein
MKKIWLILKNEFISTVFRKSFLLTLILVPLVPLVITLITSAAAGETKSNDPVSQLVTGPAKTPLEGLVDRSGLVREVPVEFRESLKMFPDEADARMAIDSGQIDAYYIVTEDYLQSGKIDLYRKDFNPLSGIMQSTSLHQTLLSSLLKGDAGLVERISHPMNLNVVYLADPSASRRNPGDISTFMVPYAIAMIFYIVIFGSASLMLNSITSEKQNRVLEILMTSANPTEILTGKMIALGLVGLLQTLFWSIGGLVLLGISGRFFEMPAGLHLSPVLIMWAAVFFILGYALYASLMAGIGALVPNLREASQVTIVVVIPMIIPLMLLNVFVRSPNGALGLIFSLFPFTAPITMMMRMSITEVPLWQPLLSCALLLLTSALVVRSVVGMFRAQNLIYGGPFNIKIFFRALFGRF